MCKQFSMLWLYISFLHQTTTDNVANATLLRWLYISFLHQTTTRTWFKRNQTKWLYISFLHQTTTCWCSPHPPRRWLYISFLHQTTTHFCVVFCFRYGFISLFYIKPQLLLLFFFVNDMALYLFSTSNHNASGVFPLPDAWLYISFLHQTTTDSKEPGCCS